MPERRGPIIAAALLAVLLVGQALAAGLLRNLTVSLRHQQSVEAREQAHLDARMHHYRSRRAALSQPERLLPIARELGLSMVRESGAVAYVRPRRTGGPVE